MDEIAAYLIQKETITGKEFMEIFHQVIAKRNGNAEEAVENQKYKKESEKARREQKTISARWAFSTLQSQKEEGHMAFDIQEELKKLPGNPASI